jgi:hypothetical protein
VKNFNDINSFVDLYKHDHVNYCYCNIGGIELAVNLVKSSNLQKLPIVFFALDKESIGKMKGLCDVVDASNLGYDIHSNFLNYNTPEFNWICFAKYYIAKPILESGRTLTYLDTDIVVKNNFQADILNQLNKNQDHLLIQSNHEDLPCAGFFSLSPSFDKDIINLFLTQDKPEIHDQDFLRPLIAQNKVKSTLLDKDLYPNGGWYYRHSERIDKTCKIIHFNCVIGKNTKISKMKEYGYYEI